MELDVLFLGLVQGMTEFLPVSSSGHLSIAKIVFGVKDASLSFDLLLHMSTLLAVCAYFAKDIVSFLIEWLYGFANPNARSWTGWRFGWAVIIGTLITAPFGIALKHIEPRIASNLLWIGGNFWLTGLLLLSTRFIQDGWERVRIRDGVPVGIVQGISVMPGISRSGSTIWAGMLCGLSREDAFRFSFLLSIPAIVGATIFEARELGGYEQFIADLPHGWPAAAAAAFISGIISLIVVRRLVMSAKWWLFAIYCIALGSAAVVFSITKV